MAISRVSFQSGGLSGGQTFVSGVSVAAGQALVVGVLWYSATITVTNFTATGESNATPLDSPWTGGPDNSRIQWAVFPNCSAGTKTVEAVLSAAPSASRICVWVVDGHDTAAPVDGATFGASGTGVPTVGKTTAAANEAIFGICVNSGAGSASGTGYTDDPVPDDVWYQLAEYDIDVGAAGSKTLDWADTGATFVLSGIAIKQAGGAPAAVAYLTMAPMMPTSWAR